MTDDDKQAPLPEAGRGARDHSWFSSPLDWPQIDRMILLAGLVLISPIAFGISLWLVMWMAPEWLHRGSAIFLMTVYVIYAASLIAFIVAASARRRTTTRWPALEHFVIWSYNIITLLESWLTGTHFSEGLLLIFLGISLAAPLSSIRILKRAYISTFGVVILLGILGALDAIPHAPLLARPLYRPDGSPVLFWFGLEWVIALALLALLYIALATTERWSNREDTYRQMSTLDGLTHLTNHRAFIERGEREFRRARRMATEKIACIMVDIDHFKAVNDRYGHAAGDSVLVTVSRILMDGARQYDEVGRYGGEEFALLLPGADADGARVVAERLRTEIAAAETTVDAETIRVTASFGVACYPDGGMEDLAGLLKAADSALYDAKNTGRNRVVTAGPDTTNQAASAVSR